MWSRNSEINIDVEEQKDTYLLKIKANCFVPFLSLDFKDADVTLEDNFFHITDTEEKSNPCRTKKHLELVILKMLRI